MPVLIPGSKVGSDTLKVKILMIFGRPKIGFFGYISGAPGYIPPIPASYQPRREWERGGRTSSHLQWLETRVDPESIQTRSRSDGQWFPRH